MSSLWPDRFNKMDMKKILIFLLLINQLGQAQNLFARQNFAGRGFSFNTYIGGVSGTITSKTQLAIKLGISSTRIENFTIVGSDIKCKITGGSYVMPLSVFFEDTSLTYYRDFDNLVSTITYHNFNYCISMYDLKTYGVTSINSSNSFHETPLLSELYFPNLTSCADSGFATSIIIPKKVFYIPICISLGSTSGDNGVFLNVASGSEIYCHPSLATNNAGGEDGDVAYARSRGCYISFVSSFTAPSPVTTLAAGTIYNTAIQLNFTPPSSTNAIQYYECYANGVLKNRITGSGQYITGLTASTSYSDITIKAVDIFYNRSISNTLNVSTNTTSAVLTTGLVSYYKLDSNSNDSFGSNNGTDTSVSYVSGKVNNAASFNGTTSKIVANLSAITSKASINFWVKLVNNTPSTASKTGLMNINVESNDTHYPFTDGNIYCGILTNSRKTIGVGIVSNKTQWHMITITADSVSNVWKFYQNGTLVNTSTVGSFSMLSIASIGKSLGAFFLDGLIDEIAVYNTEKSQAEIQLLYNNGAGTTL